MGFYLSEATCNVCGKDAGTVRYRLADNKWCCKKCYKRAELDSSFELMTISVDEVKEMIQKRRYNDGLRSSFVPSRKVGSYLAVDDKRRLWTALGSFGSYKGCRMLGFDDIKGVEIIEVSGPAEKRDANGLPTGGMNSFSANPMSSLGNILQKMVDSESEDAGPEIVCLALRVKVSLKSTRLCEYISVISAETSIKSSSYEKAYGEAIDIVKTLRELGSLPVDEEIKIIHESTKPEDEESKEEKEPEKPKVQSKDRPVVE